MAFSRVIISICILYSLMLVSYGFVLPMHAPRLRTPSLKAGLFGKPGGDEKSFLSGSPGAPDADYNKMFADMAEQFASQAGDLKDRLTKCQVVGSSSTGEVKATFNGACEPLDIEISPTILAKGADAVSAAATEAVINAYKKSTELVDSIVSGKQQIL